MKLSGLFVAGLALAVAGCSSSSGPGTSGNGAPTSPSQQESATQGNVDVERVRVFIKEGRLQALAEGNLGDGCTKLQSVRQTRAGNAISIAVTSVREGEICTMIMQRLTEWVALDGPFEPGSYTVRANGASLAFRLVRDSAGALAVDPDPGPVPESPWQPVDGHTAPDTPRNPGNSPGQTPPSPPSTGVV